MKNYLLLLLFIPIFAYSQSALSDGALIMRPMKDMPYFFHYGVMYQGKVAHYSVDGFKYTSIEDFSDGLPVTVVLKGKYGDDLKAFKERYIQVTNQYKKLKYDAANNNCEHFTNELVFGIKQSFQSEFVLQMLQTYWEPIKTQLLYKDPSLKGYVGIVDAYINNLSKKTK